MKQRIQFCTSRDGVRIAVATVGQGPPLVRVNNWFTHLEIDWDSPVWRHWVEAFVERRMLIRYDPRGSGSMLGWQTSKRSSMRWVYVGSRWLDCARVASSRLPMPRVTRTASVGLFSTAAICTAPMSTVLRTSSPSKRRRFRK
jgi:hypothetical protein